MSSTHFTITPLAGDSGTTRITFRPTGNNNTHSDYVATAVVDNGTDRKTISIIQYGIPTFYPATGGSAVAFASSGQSVEFGVYSHYRFLFDFPSWITVQDGVGISYASGQSITASASTTGNFVFTASPNTGESDRSGAITMYHYGLDYPSVSSAVTTIPISQPAGDSSPYFIISTNLLRMDYMSAQTRTIGVATNVGDWSASVNPQYWQLSKDDMESWTDPIPNELRVTNTEHNNSGYTISGQIDISCIDTAYGGTVQVLSLIHI